MTNKYILNTSVFNKIKILNNNIMNNFTTISFKLIVVFQIFFCFIWLSSNTFANKKLKLDSIVTDYGVDFNEYNVNTFKYDFNYNCIRNTNYVIEEPNKIRKILNDRIYKFDSNNNLIFSEIYDFNKTTGIKLGKQKFEKTFNENNLETSNINYSWNTADTNWVRATKTETNFNKANKITQIDNFKWNNINQDWQINNTKTFDFLNDTLETENSSFNYDSLNNEKQIVYKNIKEYDDKLRLKNEESYIFNNSKNDLIGKQKQTINYDINDKKINIRKYNWEFNKDSWLLVEEEKNEYLNNFLIRKEVLSLNEKSNKRLPIAIYEYKFDQKNNLIQTINYIYDESTNDMTFNNKIEFTYDEYKNVISTIKYEWDFEQKVWYGLSKNTKTYEINRLSNSTDYAWSDELNDWKNLFKVDYNFNENTQLNQEIEYNWNDNTKNWIPANKIEYIQFNQYYNKYSAEYFWSSTIQDWYKESKVEREFDKNDKIITSKSYLGTHSTNDWKLNYMENNKNDDYGNELEKEVYNYNQNTGIFDLNHKYIKEFNTNFKKEEVALPINNTFDWINIKTLEQGYERFIKELHLLYNTTYYYSNDFTSIENDSKNNHSSLSQNFILYPNPTAEKIYINLNDVGFDKIKVFDVYIYDMMGNLLGEFKNYHNNQELNFNNLLNGTYNLIIKSPSLQITQKLVINR